MQRRTVHPVPVTLRSTIRQRHTDGAKDRAGLETRDVEASGDTYEEARAALDAQVPDGWQLLHITSS